MSGCLGVCCPGNKTRERNKDDSHVGMVVTMADLLTPAGGRSPQSGAFS